MSDNADDTYHLPYTEIILSRLPQHKALRMLPTVIDMNNCEETTMSDLSNWGPCVSCKWWQIEPDSSIDNNTMGQCVDEKLQAYEFRVSGSSGCNRYMEGEPARARGSSDRPPSAAPAR